MNPVNATALYVSASRAVLQCDPRHPHSFADMYTLLPFFRQSLACLVCGKHLGNVNLLYYCISVALTTFCVTTLKYCCSIVFATRTGLTPLNVWVFITLLFISIEVSVFVRVLTVDAI